MGKRSRKRTRKSSALVSEELTVAEDVHKDGNGDICLLGDPDLDTGACKKPREDYEATGDISVDFPEDVELDVGTETTDTMTLIPVPDDQESLLDGNLSTDSEHKHPDEALGSHSDSALIKSEIFDPAYDMHQYLASGASDYDLGLLNGIDPLHTFNMKQEPMMEDGLLNSVVTVRSDQQLNTGGLTAQLPVPMISLPANCLTTAIPVSIPNACVAPVSAVESLTVASPNHTQNAGANAILASPILLPSGPSLNNAFAQIAKIEPGADGKGYVLHLNIPAMAGGQVAVSSEALLGASPRLLVANTCQVPGESTENQDVHSVLAGGLTVASQMDSCTGTTASLSPSTDGEEIDPTGDSPQPGLLEGIHTTNETCILQPGVDDGIDAEEDISATSVEETLGSASSDDGSVGGESSRRRMSTGSAWSGSGSGPVTTGYEDPDVERFVICSDGPMECVLCSFKTESYSAFKSHIICSHPCWRITKKLSKNRLLVEKSVRMNVSIAQPITQAQLKKLGVQQDLEDSLIEQPQALQKSLKSNSQSTRRRQLIERNKRLFKCTTCFRLFVFEGSIVNHLLDHHMVKKPYDYIQVSNDHGKSFGLIHRCPHKNCFVSCASMEELERHKSESHAQYVFRCQICGFTADTTQAVREHASTIHHQFQGLAD